MKKFTVQLLCVLTLAIGIASAATPYDVTLLDPVSVGKTELKAGDYKVEMQGDKAVFTSGKKSIAIPATLGKEAERNRPRRHAGQNHLRAISGRGRGLTPPPFG
jgi:hypothetical protein